MKQHRVTRRSNGSGIALRVVLFVTVAVTFLTSQVTLPTVRVHAQVSLPGVRIAYVSGGSIWVLDGVTGRRIRVSSGPHDFSPRWIAGGRALLFERDQGRSAITMRWTQGKPVRAVRKGLWSPDGTAVAFALPSPPVPGIVSASSLWVRRNGRTTRITPLDPRVTVQPFAWSPDSTRLAFAGFTIPSAPASGSPLPPSRATLGVAAFTGRALRLRSLPMPALSPGNPAWPDRVGWSPDGRFLTVLLGPNMGCASCRADGGPYVAISLRTGRAVRLGAGLNSPGSTSWARNGAVVVLSAGFGRETYMVKHLVSVDPGSGKRRALAPGPGWADVDPAVSPNGKQLAFARGRAYTKGSNAYPVPLIETRRIFLMGIAGSHPHSVATAVGWTDEWPSWSPDGRWILFVRWQRHTASHAAAAELWAVRPNGTGAQELAQLDLPAGFGNGFGFYGTFNWQDLFAISPG